MNSKYVLLAAALFVAAPAVAESVSRFGKVRESVASAWNGMREGAVSDRLASLSDSARSLYEQGVANSADMLPRLRALPVLFTSWITAQDVSDAKVATIAGRALAVTGSVILVGYLLKKLFFRKKAQEEHFPRYAQVEQS